MILYTSLAIAAFAFSITTAIFSILAFCKVVGMEKSTHQIQWMPVEGENQNPTGKELLKQFVPDEEY